MQWDKISEEIKSIDILDVKEINPVWFARIFSLLDLTSLNENDTEASMALFCEKAQTSLGHVACVCTYPRFTKLMAAQFAGTPIKVATVANFPSGTASLESTLIEIGQALQDGAQEMDVVFPYRRYLANEKQNALNFVAACKAACGDSVKLKVILETGVLRDLDLIATASKEVLLAGADFIKTSTGKMGQGATLEVAGKILLVIQEVTSTVHRKVGLKVSGGIKTIQEAIHYIQLADYIMGKDWVQPNTFRIGSSKLIDELESVR